MFDIFKRKSKWQPRPSDTIDLTYVWSWCVFQTFDGGQTAFIQVHQGRSPRVGDYLIIPNKGSTTRYRVVEVDIPFASDVDFWGANLVFDPR